MKRRASPPEPAAARDDAGDLLARLQKAGPGGATAAGLRLGKAPDAARRESLAALVSQERVCALGSGKTVRYVLSEHVPTAASVAARVLALAGTAAVLWREPELRRKLPAHERALLGPALDNLRAQRQLLPLRHGRNVFLAFAAPLREWLRADDAPTPPDAVENAAGIDDATLFFAYSRLVRESGGFPDVKIAHLQRVLGPSPLLGERLSAFWREGRATLSLGDWSLADEETRAAAVELDGEKYLLVRLDETAA